MLLLAGALAGCVETTQQKNERAQLQSERVLATRSAVRVTRQDPSVAVVKVSALRGPAGTAVAVTVRNGSPRALSDLPVNVGVQVSGGHTLYLNRQAELPYSQTHLGGLGAGAQATWVFNSAHPAPHGRAVARVGAGTIPVPKGVARVPAIDASVASVRSQGRGRALASVEVTNHSGVAQSGLQLYAYALAGERLVAAGSAPLQSLGSNSNKTLQIPLLGNPGAAAVHVEVPPTNLQ